MNDHPQASSPFRTSQLEENDGPGHNTSGNPTMGEIISSRFSRRGLLKGSLAVAAIFLHGPMGSVVLRFIVKICR